MVITCCGTVGFSSLHMLLSKWSMRILPKLAKTNHCSWVPVEHNVLTNVHLVQMQQNTLPMIGTCVSLHKHTINFVRKPMCSLIMKLLLGRQPQMSQKVICTTRLVYVLWTYRTWECVFLYLFHLCLRCKHQRIMRGCQCILCTSFDLLPPSAVPETL